MDNLFKLGQVVEGSEEAYRHPKTYKHENDANRIVAGISTEGVDLVSELIENQPAPLFLLYVLHTPRGEGKAGRYQSPSLSPKTTLEFMKRFSGYLDSDSRFDLWIHSQETQSTIVWDRHNMVYAYGELDCVKKALINNGFNTGNPSITGPHVHYYHAEFDSDAEAVLDFCEWTYSPLKPEDEQ